MSISQEISRISAAKAEIISVLRARGVDVPADTPIENIAGYIASMNIVGKDDTGVYYGGSNAVLLSDENGVYAKAL